MFSAYAGFIAEGKNRITAHLGDYPTFDDAQVACEMAITFDVIKSIIAVMREIYPCFIVVSTISEEQS